MYVILVFIQASGFFLLIFVVQLIKMDLGVFKVFAYVCKIISTFFILCESFWPSVEAFFIST